MNAGSGFHVGIYRGVLALADLRGGAGAVSIGKGAGVGLLRKIPRSLVDRHVALVLGAGAVDAGVVDDG